MALEQGEVFDLFLLDIEMPDGINGVELGRLIRQKFNLTDALLIYISSYTDYYEQLFPLHVYNFIRKDLKSHSFLVYAEAIKEIEYIRKKRLADDSLMMQYNQDGSSIKLYRILYIESRGHKNRMTYFDIDNQFKDMEYYATMKEAKKILLQYDFVVPHNSYVVNMRRIHQYEKDSIVMDNGEVIKITYTKARVAKARLNRFFDR